MIRNNEIIEKIKRKRYKEITINQLMTHKFKTPINDINYNLKQLEGKKIIKIKRIIDTQIIKMTKHF